MPGLTLVRSNQQLDAEQAAADAAYAQQAYPQAQEPVITGLVAHVRRCWEAARDAKQPIERDMLKALRQRKGEYEPDKLADIRAAGGSEIFMMVTETKCRGAESWLRDILLDEGSVPFDLKPTPMPDLPPAAVSAVTQAIGTLVIQQIQSGMPIDQMMMDVYREQAETDIRRKLLDEANDRASAMKRRIDDQFFEGGLITAFNDFLSDLTTYPAAVLKGPIVRRKRQLEWAQQADGSFIPQVQEKLAPTYDRVDPYRFYTEPGITKLTDGYTLEHHKLSAADLSDMLGVPGYNDDAIRAVLATGANNEWMWSGEMTKSQLENKHNIWRTVVGQYDALEFWGRVSGKLLVEWGMEPIEVPDQDVMYDANVWIVGSQAIKATLNYDPLGDKPYRMMSMVKRPGALWGAGIPELIEDVQAMCNAAARALANNMGIASGPQVEVQVDRLAQGEVITKMYPWKIWQTVSDPAGSGQPAIRFNQPDDRSAPLMTVYQNFLRMADDQSGIPAYVYGDGQVGGAGRTASGLSMLMGSAGKGIRQVIMGIDFDIIGPLVTAQYNWNMQFVDDPAIKGDCEIIPRGAVQLANREQLNVRRVEFLQATANPIDAQIVGIPGRASILREVAKGLGMPVDDIVPDDEKLEILENQQMQQQMLAQQQLAGTPDAGPQDQGGPGEVQFTRGEDGSIQGAKVWADGSRKGGQDNNVVANKSTGRSA